MLERIADLPAGTLGFRASGELTREDYYETLVPALRGATGTGPLRVLAVAENVEKLDVRHVLGEGRSNLPVGLDLRRTALVSDVGWIRLAFHLLTRLLPGEFELFHLADEERARAWLAA
jgi:hypothetical protein